MPLIRVEQAAEGPSSTERAAGASERRASGAAGSSAAPGAPRGQGRGRNAALAVGALALVLGVGALGWWVASQAGAGGASAGASGDPAAVVARVNGQPITRSDVDGELAVQTAMQAQRGRVLTPDAEDLAAFRRDLLDELVNQVLMLQDAARRGIVVSQADALAEVPQWAVGIDIDRLRNDALAGGATEQQLAEWAQRQVVIARYLREPEVQEMGMAEVRSRGGLPRPPQSADVAAALEDDAEIVFRFGGFGDDEAVELPAAKEGAAAPDFTLDMLDGPAMSLSELKGQPVLVNFWATWCAPCQAEMPLYKHVYERNKDKGLVILAVNVQEDEAQVRPFVEQRELPFPIAMDRSGQVATLYRVRGLPTSVFVARDGSIQNMHRGSILQRETLLELLRPVMPDVGT